MTDQHPITPPPELVQQWWTEFERTEPDTDSLVFIATQAARWGADQELEECCEWLASETPEPYINALCVARRPTPPSLKAQALAALNTIEDKMLGPTTEEKLIRRALEQLND